MPRRWMRRHEKIKKETGGLPTAANPCRTKRSEKGLLTPDNRVVAIIDLQPQNIAVFKPCNPSGVGRI